MSFIKDFDHLKIQLKNIISATDNFASNKLIGRGGFGSVYKGELSRSEGQIIVACKRLEYRNSGQGNAEFWKEIITLSKCKHENIVSLLNFCIDGDERILVYKYESHGSLDRYLSDTSLTWIHRLKICIGVARGLNYLHDPKETHQRLIHRDIKSSNILLDEKWVAKVSDFGLSKVVPANQPHTYVFSNAVGTPGYCDPLYRETGFLTKESDVYSFGVVLFEVMCGTLCCEYHHNGQYKVLVPMWQNCFEQDRLDDIICHGIKDHMEPGSLKTFSTIAYQCLKKAREERPTMAEILQQLEIALELQEMFEEMGKRMNSKEILKIADLVKLSLPNISQSQLLLRFMRGILIDNGKTWFWVNKKGKHCELISAAKCVSAIGRIFMKPSTNPGSRFKDLFIYESTRELTLRVKTQFLTPHVTYIVNLVYECGHPHQGSLRIPFKYIATAMRQLSTSCVAYLGKDGWLRTELFQFTSTKMMHDFDIQFLSETKFGAHHKIFIEGIEFCPETDEKIEDKNKVDKQSLTNVGIDWDKKLPYDYTEILKWSKDTNIESLTKKEVYLLLRKGLHIKNPLEWFSIGEWFFISNNSKKRHMIPARSILQDEILGWNFLSRRESWVWKSLPGSRFNEVAETCDTNHLAFSLLIKGQLLSPKTTYACYLVYKLPENGSMFEGIVVTRFRGRTSMYGSGERHVYLLTPPHTPIIELSTNARPSRTRKIKGHPKLRKDGWMEIQVWEFIFTGAFSYFKVYGYLKSLNEWNFTGLLVQGIEFRPAKVIFDPKPYYV